MRDEIDRATRVKRELFMRSIFPGKPPAAVARQMVKMMRERSLLAGEILYERGDEAKEAYLVLDGRVELTGEAEEPYHFEKGSVLGMLDCSLERPRERRAVALSDVDLLVLDGEDWMSVFEENLSYARIVRDVLGRMHHDLVLQMAPGGGFPSRQLSPEEALEAGVLEGGMVDRLVALSSSFHFETASVQSLAELSTRGEIIRGPQGRRLLDPGAAGQRLFVVVAGIVEMERTVAPVVRATFGPGDLVLGSVSLAGLVNEYSMTARTDCLVLSFDASDFDDVIEDHFDLARSMFRGISLDRVRTMATKAKAEPAKSQSEGTG